MGDLYLISNLLVYFLLICVSEIHISDTCISLHRCTFKPCLVSFQVSCTALVLECFIGDKTDKFKLVKIVHKITLVFCSYFDILITKTLTGVV